MKRFSQAAAFLALGAFWFVAAGMAQTGTKPATLKFSLDWPESDPSHYSLAISSDGHGSYTSDGKLATASDETPAAPVNFTLSPAMTAHIFDLVKRGHYLQGDIELHRKIAFTGAKVLSYDDSDHKVEVKYNYSSIQAIQELTGLLQGLSITLEFGRRLEYELQYQKLALDDELKKVEQAKQDDQLPEVAVLAPTLKKIADDHSTLNVVRARAERLLAAAGPTGAGNAHSSRN